MLEVNQRSLTQSLDRQFDHVIGTPKEWRSVGDTFWTIGVENNWLSLSVY
jgi:hypothetical protein